MATETLKWIGGIEGHIDLIDQTLLPNQHSVISIRDIEEMWEAIKVLRVRGAPAIGISAAYGVILGMQPHLKTCDLTELKNKTIKAADYLATSRPTAVNLFWALDRMKKRCLASASSSTEQLCSELLNEAHDIRNEDAAMCRAIGKNGMSLIPEGGAVLTHCNAGGLATADYGTALAVMFAAHESGKKFRVFADETRPLLQGARLTVWELMHAGIDVTLNCDNMAGWMMQQKMINLIIVGADRIAANGDTANKIGTYSLAVLAKHHNIPFYVAAPYSTFDMGLPNGQMIPIEQRDAAEIIEFVPGRRTAPANAKVYNPAFDVTPAELITAFITEIGVIEPQNIKFHDKLTTK
ncbi:MAG: S-methyl-5-thioribose-1-phosphate isomerase [Sedimentisphaerales bacterium]|nr:S-methyl-5-thioribose-1-phosphate isomerase [Sedimentisphaerales bacterium]